MKKSETYIIKGAISAPYPTELAASLMYRSHSIYHPMDDNRINDVVIDYATNSAPDGNLYTKEDVLIAGEIGEINHHDYKHIASLLAEARDIRLKLNR